jgi:hypothetical protein
MSDEKRLPYDVGYGKPPVTSQFRPGTSGNPKGRPRKLPAERSYTRRQIRRDVIGMMETIISVRTKGAARKMTRIQALLHTMMEQAFRGDRVSQRYLYKLYFAAIREHESDSIHPRSLRSIEELEQMYGTGPAPQNVYDELNWARSTTRKV